MRLPSIILTCALLTGGCVLTAGQTPAASRPTQATTVPTIPDGTAVQLRLIRMVSSESDQVGEQVEFEIVENLVVEGTTLATPGTSVWGKVTAASPADRTRRGTLEIQVEGLRLASGQLVPLRNLKQLPVDASADVAPENLANLVNSPYAPFQRFTRGTDITVPKSTRLTLYVAADVPVVAPRASSLREESHPEAAAGTVADRIVGGAANTVSLGDIAREQRRRGIAGSGATLRNSETNRSN